MRLQSHKIVTIRLIRQVAIQIVQPLFIESVFDGYSDGFTNRIADRKADSGICGQGKWDPRITGAGVWTKRIKGSANNPFFGVTHRSGAWVKYDILVSGLIADPGQG